MKGDAVRFCAVEFSMLKLRGIKKLVTMLTCTVLTISVMAAYSGYNDGDKPIHAKTIAEIQEERKQNEAKIQEYEDQIQALEGDKANEKAYQDTLSDQIALIQNNILLLDTELEQISASIGETEKHIEQLNSDIEAQQLQIDANIELFKERLCAMYVTGNDTLASAILGSTDFYDMLSRVEMINSIAEHDEQLINDLMNDITALEKSKSDLETEKLTLEMSKQTQETKKAEKEAEIAELNDKMIKSQEEIDRLALEQEKMNKSKDELEADNAALDAQEEEILEQIRRDEEERKRKEEEALKQQQQQQSNNNSSSGETIVIDTSPAASGFSWPTPGFYYISSGYGSRWGTTHKGIDIAGGGISGAPVCASKGGTVIAVVTGCSHNYPKSGRCCGNGYGNYVTVSHGDGYTTVYAHLSSVNVSVGDSVSQGQVLGYVGSTGFSTGYHLHFEVRKNGVAQNPQNYV